MKKWREKWKLHHARFEPRIKQSKEALVKQLKQIKTTQARNRTLYREVQGAHEARRFIKRVEANSAVKRHASAVKQTVANGIAMRRLCGCTLDKTLAPTRLVADGGLDGGFHRLPR